MSRFESWPGSFLQPAQETVPEQYHHKPPRPHCQGRPQRHGPHRPAPEELVAKAGVTCRQTREKAAHGRGTPFAPPVRHSRMQAEREVVVKRRPTKRRSAGGRRRARRPKPGPRETALAHEPGRLRRLLRLLGPGVISGASDDDPATVGTCASAGASAGGAGADVVGRVRPGRGARLGVQPRPKAVAGEALLRHHCRLDCGGGGPQLRRHQPDPGPRPDLDDLRLPRPAAWLVLTWFVP